MRKNKPNKNYKSKNHSKFILTYHIIFTCKYRKKLLIKYGEDVKQIMYDISKKYDFDIKEMEVDTKIATQAHSFRCGLVAQQYKLFNKLNYIFNFTMEIFTYAI